ncbi:MAG: hypothetical protein IK115_09620 [Lachnospiraceae bacterium]|nr:hypothetical protein [Lachnospiraceae bacterium]
MSDLGAITDTIPWYFICIVALILLVGSITIFLRAVFDARGKITAAFAAMNLLLSFCLYFILMDCFAFCNMTTSRIRAFLPFEERLFAIPYFYYALIEVVSGVLLLLCSRDALSYRKRNLTQDSIKQALDSLPEGILISSRDGIVRLANLKMNRLCRLLTGEILKDAGKFREQIMEMGKKQGSGFLVRSEGGIFLFEKGSFELHGDTYERITAVDVSDRYQIIDELEEKNGHLLDIKRRMKDATELSAEMFISQEEADARAALHNQLGQVLLMGRHYIQHKDTTDPKLVYMATRQMNSFLLGEEAEPYKGEEDDLSRAVAMAGSIGVTVSIRGEIPKDSAVRELLSRALTECTANTVKHAGGDSVTVDISEGRQDMPGVSEVAGNTPDNTQGGQSVIIRITNNGTPPKGRVSESGGLLSLRRDVEAAGGVMEIVSEPEFVLSISLNQNNDLKNGTNG